MKNLLFGLIATIFLGITGNAQGLRAKFLEGKTQDQIVTDFNKLSIQDKNALWIEKLDQLLSQKLPSEHLVIISKLKGIMINNPYSSNANGFVENAVELAKITPLEDLSKMYETLYDFNYTGKFSGNTTVPQSIIDDITNMNTSTARGACSCRWCLGWGDQVHSNCKETSDGCGWFGMQPCTHALL